MTADWLPVDHAHLRDTLDRTERHLDPANPEAGGHVAVLGYGEISAALTIDALPGLVCKRMAGYRDDASVDAYVSLIDDYLTGLVESGIRVAPTLAVPVHRDARPPVLYLVQPQADAATLGHALLRKADEQTVAAALRQVLACAAGLAARNAARVDGVELAVDGQLSNWALDAAALAPQGVPPSRDGTPRAGTPHPRTGTPHPPAPRPEPPPPAPRLPMLLDVGTPFIRRDGRHMLDVEVILAPAPPGVRALLRRFVADSYQDDYFVPRTWALDLLGNFHKEGATHRIALGTDIVNEWLATTDLPGPVHAIGIDEVDRYYRQDARLLELFLRTRRADRLIRTRVLRQRYDFLLPGPVAR